MKETIYTIPIKDAFLSGYDCPFCYLKDKLDDDGIAYFLGDSLMTSEGREATNEHGFCREHWEKMFVSKHNALGLGLIMDTYLQNMNQAYFKLAKEAIAELNTKRKSNIVENIVGTLTKKLGNIGRSKKMGGSGESKSSKVDKNSKRTVMFVDFVSDKNQDCALCQRIDEDMERYVENFFYMWQSDEEFRKIFSECEGFCMDHFLVLIEGAKKYLSVKNEGIFASELIRKQYECFKKLQKDVNWFTKKFDYKNDNEPWGDAKDVLQRTVRRLHSSRLERKD